MKKFLVLAAIILTAAACNKSNENNQTPPPPPPAVTPTTQTYTNATYGFTFEYLKEMKFVTPTYPNLQDKIVQMQISKDQYPGTNFGDAAFAVSAQSAKSLADCLKLSPPENGDGFKTKVNINGVDFYMTASSGAGAGNLYESKIYRTVKSPNGACIELNETLHTGNISNYPEGSVTQVNKTNVWNKLDSVLNTFKFTN
jgi:hypothetical protein